MKAGSGRKKGVRHGHVEREAGKGDASGEQQRLGQRLGKLFVEWQAGAPGVEETIIKTLSPLLLDRTWGSEGSEDVVQDVFETLVKIKRDGTLRSPDALLAYLLKTAEGKQKQEYRRLKRLIVVELDEHRVAAPGACDAMDQRMDIGKLMNGVDGQFVEALAEYCLEGRSAREIAEAHEAPEGTVRGWIRRGKEWARRRHGIVVPGVKRVG
jgi:DNA-directed RNA polymerase specialized sigma24 family protein